MSPIIASLFLILEAAVALGILIAMPSALAWGFWRTLSPGGNPGGRGGR